jgi:transcription antitermination protein NusB
MGTRRRARELAMQALFHMDMQADEVVAQGSAKVDSTDKFDLYCRNFPPSKKAHPFFAKIVEGVQLTQDEVDKVVERYSNNWKITRMSCVDRNVLRVAVFELLYCDDIPAKVSINEAIDVGKKYGTDESGAFINGILDSIRIAMEKGEVAGSVDLRKAVGKIKTGASTDLDDDED